MTAICPAGPPKLRSATRTQVGVASLNDGYGMDAVLPTNIDLATASFISQPRLIGGPVVRLISGIATPTIEGVERGSPTLFDLDHQPEEAWILEPVEVQLASMLGTLLPAPPQGHLYLGATPQPLGLGSHLPGRLRQQGGYRGSHSKPLVSRK